jgi:hypothetical protein
METINSGIPTADWDKKLAKLGGHFYQTRTWAAFQEALGRQVIWASGEGWAWLGAIREGRGGVRYLYCSYGPVVKGSGLKPALESLKQAGQKHGVDFVRVEPTGEVTKAQIQKAGLRQFEPVQPEYVLELDITPSLDEIKKSISQSNRNLINQIEARGLSFHVSDEPSDVAVFNRIHNDTAKHGGFTNHGDDYYNALAQTLISEGAGRLYFVHHAGQPLAGAICFDWNGTRYYAFAGADPEKNRELKAAIALVWWLISDAKDQGLKVFNYGGVAPEDQPDHPWAGHSRFKRSIGGDTIQTLGTWDMPLKTAKYALYRVIKKVAR